MHCRLREREHEGNEHEGKPAEHDEHYEADQVAEHVVLVLHDRERVRLAERALRFHRAARELVQRSRVLGTRLTC